MRIAALVLVLLLHGCATAPVAAPPADAAGELAALLDAELAKLYRRNPMIATMRGVPGYDHLLPDGSLEALERERAGERAALAQARAIDAMALRGQDRVSRALLVDRLEAAVEQQRFTGPDGLVLSTLGGVHTIMPRMAQTTPFRGVDTYRDYVKRISAAGKLADETIARLRLGLRSGWVSPVAVVDRVVAAIDAQRVDAVEKSPLLAPFAKATPNLPEAQRTALAASAWQAVAADYQPGLARLRVFLRDEYRPKAPKQAGLSAFPGGRAYYDFLIRTRIAPGRDAEQIHALGLAEVARMRGEIGAIAGRVGFAGGTDAFIEHMRSDRKYFFTSADEVLETYRALAKVVDPQLPKLFHAIPRMPYGVRAMSPAEAASSSAANYNAGSLALGTSGFFTVNANGFANEAKWRAETLFVHEAVPGHHMQVARAAEIEGLHPWRSLSGTSTIAYGEGWALYAEKLGFQLGLYRDPLQHYGHLQAELFRAARLVVDTGIHAFGWDRDRAITYMRQQGGLDDAHAVSEVDRYFSNPAQALGYKIGQLKFVELRARAERALGPRFGARDFHAVAIDNGPLPLAVLEQLVDAWIVRGGGANIP